MNILFITRLYYPHIGGVEKHVYEVAKRLKLKGKSVTIFTEKYDPKLKNVENINGVKVVRFFYPHIKFFGLLNIWLQIFKQRKIILNADMVHIHDVFIWYLLFRFLFPNKKVVTTFHGWEGVYPIPKWNIFLKKLASKLSYKTIAVGKYIEKYYGIKSNKIIYGGVATPLHSDVVKNRRSMVFVGRLDKDTGLLNFLEYLKTIPKNWKVEFVGDGELQGECAKYGKVHGFCNPAPFLKKAEYCVPGGYLAALEALSYGCKLKLYWNNKVKEDYWKMSPFYKIKDKKLTDWSKSQTWEKITNEYLDLYYHI